ncbi:toll-like receptor 4 [Littorina saxatilis]|uniref:toll-like receptor 4 n=1 Tax=Littorina saxatilis TaxID=31220 RepID=UPI0038B49FB7
MGTEVRGKISSIVIFALVTSDVICSGIQTQPYFSASSSRITKQIPQPHEALLRKQMDVNQPQTIRTPEGATPSPSSRHESHGTFCFEKKCVCFKNGTADCSHNFGKLSFIPQLPPNITLLQFSYNNLTAITDDDFFSNASGIAYIDLQHNGLGYICPGAFRGLKRLRSIYLGYNGLSYEALKPVFEAEALRALTIRYMNLGPPPDDFFLQRPMPPLRTIDLSGNTILHLNFSVFVTLKHFSTLKAIGCRIASITSAYLYRLEAMHLISNDLYSFPETCKNGTSLFPHLHHVIFNDNKISGITGDVCLPRLRSLALDSNPILFFTTDMFNEGRFPRMTTLTLSDIQPIKRMEKFAFRHPRLEFLNMMYCNLALNEDVTHPDAFAGSPKLLYLQLSHSQAAGITDEKFSRLFGSIKNLEILYLGQCSLSKISSQTFSSLRNLCKLYLHRNKLVSIPDGTFDFLANLTVLTLGDNQIASIRESTFSPNMRKRLTQLDLSGNPFECDCNLLWFKEWYVRSRNSTFSHSYANYTCKNRPNTPLTSFFLQEQECLFTTETNRIIIACVVMCLIVLCIVSVMYQYRWNIRLMLAFRGHGDLMKRRLREENFDYDIFVSCAEEDEAWLDEYFMPEAEGGLGLRVCFHKRDFIPGKNILTNIIDSVKASKKFVMIFSEHFAQSRWCQFELDLCLGHVFDNDDALIVTCVGQLTPRDLTATMMAVMKTTTYIQWEEYQDDRASFWQRMRHAFKDIITGIP